MVDKFKKVLEELVKRKGDVSLFAVLKMDEFTDKWTVIVSALWVNMETKDEIFSLVRQLLIENFTNEEMATIARLGIFPLSEHIVQELLNYNVGAEISEDQKINGNIVHSAHILASNRNLVEKASTQPSSK